MPAVTKMIPRFCCVVVTYQPPNSVPANVQLLSKEFTKIVVVDNGSGAQFGPLLLELKALANVELILNAKNLGIAAALNQGIRHARSFGFDWVATFDQDSSIMVGYVLKMMDAYQTCPSREQVALISPVHCVSHAEWTRQKQCKDALYSFLRVAITSGSLIKTRVFDEVGWYDEAMFIDYVDFDFCLRLVEKHLLTIRSNRSFLIHRLGTPEIHSFLGFPITIKSHAAFRYYYIMRNRMVMYRRYLTKFPFWVLQDIIWLFLDLAKIFLFENEKPVKFSNIFEGFRHGITGRLGPK